MSTLPTSAAASNLHAPRRIVLLSSYGGGNLGDAAIIQSTIDALRERMDCEIMGATLWPERVKRVHGIDGVRLTAFGRHFYSLGGRDQDGANGPYEVHGLDLKRRFAMAYPRAFGLVKHAVHFVRGVRDELLHYATAMRFLCTADALVVAGGGQLDEEWGGPWGHPYALDKWTFVAQMVRCPVAFLSVGACKLDSRLGRRFVTRALGRAAYVSLRDPWSQSFVISTLRVPAQKAPDLAFGLRVPLPSSRKRAEHSPLRIGLSPIAYGRAKVWPTVDEEHAANYCRELMTFASKLLRDGHTVVLFHTDGPDRAIASEMFNKLRESHAAAERCPLELAATNTLPELLSVLVDLDVTIASRLHGVILSHMHSIPTIAISYDQKVARHMCQAGQEMYCLEFAGVRSEALETAFESLRNNLVLTSQVLEDMASQWRSQLDVQYDELASLLQSSSRPERED